MFRILWGLLIFMSLLPVTQADALDTRPLAAITVPAEVVQMSATADGQRFYLLLDNGVVQLLQQDGRLIDSLNVGKEVSAIEALGTNRLLLYKENRRRVEIVMITPKFQIDTKNAPVKGDLNAPVALVIYDDFECPYCAKTVPVLNDLLKRYPGKLKLVFKNFPLRMHKNANAAALAGLAAHRQGKFWPLHDLMFVNYRQLNPGKIRELAAMVGMDMARFERDMKDPALQGRITADMQEGQQIGVRGTPTLFINGRRVQKRSVQAMVQMINEELQQLK